MDIKTLKIELVQKLLQTESAEVLTEIKTLLAGQSGYVLTNEDVTLLEERQANYAAGKSKIFTREEVKELARKAML